MVYFIGAGPGDPELLTIKGKKIIDRADVIIYAGSLVNPQVMADRKLLKHVPDQFCLICILRLTLLLQKTLAAAPEGDLGSHQRHKYKCYICK